MITIPISGAFLSASQKVTLGTFAHTMIIIIKRGGLRLWLL